MKKNHLPRYDPTRAEIARMKKKIRRENEQKRQTGGCDGSCSMGRERLKRTTKVHCEIPTANMEGFGTR